MIAPMVASMRSQFATMTRPIEGCAVIERPGVTACVTPFLPERSLPNSVIYSDAEALFDAYDDIAAAHEEAGVRAWTVWAPPGEDAVGERLAQRGHVIDAEPMAMALELDRLGPPPSGPELDVERGPAGALALAEVNDRAYGAPVPTFARLAAGLERCGEVYVARVEGRPAAALAVHDHGDDAMVAFVATDPDFQRRGLAGRLLHRALRDARERGRRFSTLQASRAGEPVYARLGYESLGRFRMWERRAS